MTDEELLKNLKILAVELNKSPSAVDCNNCGYTANSSTYRTRFGSWNNAKKLAGIPETNKFGLKSNQELINSLVKFYEINNRAPTQKECRRSNGLYGPNTYKDSFGGWEEALKAAGISKSNLKFNQVSDEFLLNSLNKFYTENGRAPTHEECNDLGKFTYLKSHMIYSRRFGSFTAALDLAGIPRNTSNVSALEIEVLEFISSVYEGEILSNDRNILNSRLELDIVIPKLKVAIEVNGLYWHSSEYKSKDYHLEKTLETQAAGYRLIHIFENEWRSKRTIVENRLKHLLGLSKRIYARKCKVREISYQESRDFINTFHIQGEVPSSVNIGLFYKDVLVGVQTYSKARFSKDCEWELLRSASDPLVVGGASKLFQFFVRTYKPLSIVSYCDIRWNTGESYEKMGFILSHISEPNYWYFKSSHKVFSRVGFQKHKLNDKLKFFDSNLTEYENMYNNGYKRIYDCGNYVFKYHNKLISQR
jgi:hypothetical protein